MPTLNDLSPVTLGYVLGNIAARSGGTVPGRVLALTTELHQRGELETLLDELDPELATALGFLINVEHSRAKYPRAQRAALNADTGGS